METPDIKISQAEEFFKSMQIKKTLKLEFISRIVTICIAGLALITALAWDEVLKDVYVFFSDYFKGINQKLGYAIFITIFSVVVSIIIGKIFIKKEVKQKNND